MDRAELIKIMAMANGMETGNSYGFTAYFKRIAIRRKSMVAANAV